MYGGWKVEVHGWIPSMIHDDIGDNVGDDVGSDTIVWWKHSSTFQKNYNIVVPFEFVLMFRTYKNVTQYLVFTHTHTHTHTHTSIL